MQVLSDLCTSHCLLSPPEKFLPACCIPNQKWLETRVKELQSFTQSCLAGTGAEPWLDARPCLESSDSFFGLHCPRTLPQKHWNEIGIKN